MSREVRDLIRRLSRENCLWGAPHIHGELLKLCIDIGETTVAKYVVRHHKPPSQAWRTFLNNHVKNLVSVDFFTVPTIGFRVLYRNLRHGQLEPRFKVAVLVSNGTRGARAYPADTLNYAPRVKVPVLMFNGRYDWLSPLETSQKAMFKALRDAGSR